MSVRPAWAAETLSQRRERSLTTVPCTLLLTKGPAFGIAIAATPIPRGSSQSQPGSEQ